ncbi:putative membrane protein [Streptomyces canus]|uniref:hypothetical protein n=1 Tax=Streptomyces canus TaxID=58343 RepID=UPI0027860F1D|nr:hypothetical protein [Streptomyces canus]MDQ0605078.1 putative membrane protein [Streptomyces canus]
MLVLLLFLLGWAVLLTFGVGMSTLQGPPRAALRWWILYVCALAGLIAALVLTWQARDAYCRAHPTSWQCGRFDEIGDL